MEHMYANLNRYRTLRSPEREAIYDYDNQKHYTYGDLDQRAEKLANYLVNVLGLVKGDCVGFCSTNAVAFFDAFFATYKTGIIITTYNCLLNENELKLMILNEKPKVLFYEEDFEEKLFRIKTEIPVEKYVNLSKNTQNPDAEFYDDIMAQEYGELSSRTSFDSEDIQMYIHTGGTTGIPKAAMISYKTISMNIVSEIITLGIHMDDSAYIFLPLFHTAGWNVITLPLLFCGGRIILKKCFKPQSALEIIREERPTISVAVPTIYKLMADHEDFEKTDFSCYKWMLVGAAPVREVTAKAYFERNIKLVNAYGMTEVGPNNLVNPVQDMSMELLKAKWNSVGKPFYFNEVRIVNDDGDDVKQGQSGELIFKGPLTFSGYLNQQDETRNIMKDGWVYTGDIVRVDEDGFYYIVGRKKNMYIACGENIFPIEIENLICNFEGIKECCVFGVPDDKWGEVGKAIIVVDESKFDIDRLKEYLLGNLSTVKRPKHLQIVETVPKNGAGKVDYRLVNELYGIT